MDTSDAEITFDKNGICNHCKRYDDFMHMYTFTKEDAKIRLAKLINKIKLAGVGKEYDCILGISGGVDSSYCAVLAHEQGLRVLAVHLDNGWNTELSVHNIEKVLKALGIDLYTHAIDRNEFKGLQLAYLRSGCANIEVLTDHAIWASLYHEAGKRDIKYILSGTNIVTEGMLPTSWGYDHKDLVNILDIYNKNSDKKPLATFPMLSFGDFIRYHYLKRIEYISLLNYISYNKAEVKKLLGKTLGWQDYPGKHGESVFTYFYQSFMLPRRLHIDKRIAHLSCLVCAGNISRQQALDEMAKPLYKDEKEQLEAIDYVARKLGLSSAEFLTLVAQPVVSNYNYKIDHWYTNPITSSIKKGKIAYPIANLLLKLLKVRG